MTDLKTQRKNNCIFEIPRKIVFLHCMYDMYFFPKHNWICQLSAVLGTVIRCPKGTQSVEELSN